MGGDMDAKMDEMKGRMKEAAGDLTDDDRKKREGKTDRLGATAKEKTGEMADKAKDMVDKAKDIVDRDR